MYERDLEWLTESLSEKTNRYPLTDLSVTENEDILIDIAVAGFGEEDLDIEMISDTIVITGTYNQEAKEPAEYIRKFISISNFERVIQLNRNYVDSKVTAQVVNGVLNIKIEKKEKPRKIIKIG